MFCKPETTNAGCHPAAEGWKGCFACPQSFEIQTPVGQASGSFALDQSAISSLKKYEDLPC